MFIFLIYFFGNPAEALDASRRGLMLWLEQLLPALLPFTVLSYVILNSGIFSLSAKKPRYKRRFAFMPDAKEWYVICCGFLFGFPIGSKLTADLYSEKQITREQASILFLFTNNLSPAFVTSVFEAQLKRRPSVYTYLLLYGIPFAYGMILLFCNRLQARTCNSEAGNAVSDKQKNTASRFGLNMQIIDAGIINGFETLIKICGYIMLFSLAAEQLKMLPYLPSAAKTFLIGCTEVTNGMSELASFSGSGVTKYMLAMLFLSWGGISGMFQTASIISRTDLSMKKYVCTRLCLTALTAASAWLLLRLGIR